MHEERFTLHHGTQPNPEKERGGRSGKRRDEKEEEQRKKKGRRGGLERRRGGGEPGHGSRRNSLNNI